jgi:hypothetical protein
MAIKGKYIIKKIRYEAAMNVIIKHHYLHRPAPCSFAFGLYEINGDKKGLFIMDRLVGVITYGTPSSAPLRGGICGLEEKNNVIELTRLWVEDTTPKNAESYLIGNTIHRVNKEIIVSFAEIEAGHTGIVYQATNWIYTGLSAKRTNWNVEGVQLHGQTIADKYTSKELKEICGDRFSIKERPRKHRYIFLNCNKKRKKILLSKLRYPIKSYPKKFELINS